VNYLDYQYQFVEFFVDHLVDMSRVFRGDLQLMLVLAILGQVKIRAVQDAVQGGMPASEAVLITQGISATRLADITGIPRQTVRRKLMALERRGWAVQTADQTWCLTVRDDGASVRSDLADTDARAMARIARLFVELEVIAERRR
jgi:predicted transcriptional regulator